MRAPPSQLPGTLAGRYVLERIIGQGASATVHLARDTVRGIAVAIKLLRQELVDSRAAQRFLREIRRTAELRHPHIVPVLDSGEVGGQSFFVLPYMEGGTLRHLLQREKVLELERVIEIARPVADALDFAHKRGVVHRDVKPENILFTNGQACLADFGIARAIEVSGGGGDTTSTSTNAVRGTPAYMSPEQAAGGSHLDGRSDVYSLACVLYEMITGMPAFVGPTAESVISQRFAFPPRDVRVYRPTAPIGIDVVLARAFAMTPADRFRTAGELVAALGAAITAQPSTESPAAKTRGRSPVRTKVLRAAAVVALAVIASMTFVQTRDGATDEEGPSNALSGMDTSRYAVLPVEEGDSLTAGVDIPELLRDSFRRWQGIHVVDGFLIRDAMARRTAAEPRGDAARSAALILGAGRYVRLHIDRFGDSLSIRAALFDVRDRSPLIERGIRLASGGVNADSVIGLLGDTLLIGLGSRARPDLEIRTHSLPARLAYLAADAAMSEWNLSRADSLLNIAVEQDPGFTAAYLWLAQIRSWQRDAPERWRHAADAAASSRGDLSSRDSMRATALVALASGDREDACDAWRQMTRLDARDFVAWYSLGICLAFDAAVLRSQDSPTGWRFRSSYNEAIDSFERAFLLLPSIHRSFSGQSFDEMRRLFKTNGELRVGMAVSPDSGRFLAHPSLDGDTLAFFPAPAAEFHATKEATLTRAISEAARYQRRRLHRIAVMWRASFPSSAGALEGVAVTMEQLGDPSALDTLRMARRMATQSADRIRMGVTEVWMQVKSAIPGSPPGLREARDLADSLLRAYTPMTKEEAGYLGSLAALLGRASLAASYNRMADAELVPRAAAHAAPSLVAYASLGGPRDSLRLFEEQLYRASRTVMTASETSTLRSNWITRAAALAVPDYTFRLLGVDSTSKGRTPSLLRALSNRDLGEAKRVLAELREQRRRAALRSYEISTDGIYVEAAILAALGDARAAIGWLDPTLDSLSHSATHEFASVPRAGALLRCVILRAQLAAAVGDSSSAKRWAVPIEILWSNADAFLQPTISRVKRLGS